MSEPFLSIIGDAINTMRDRDAVILRAVADVIKDRVHAIPDITVQVDTKAIADAMSRNEGDLVKFARDVPSPQITVKVDMKPVADAIEEMGKVLLKALQPREPRKITITHDDGTKSVVRED